jgi:hypothetical protein
MSTLESKIDALYASRLDEFVAARAALVAELKGADARTVRQLKKPTSVPWAVNQVYWHGRALFDRLQRSGTELRSAQVTALEGRPSDVRAAADAHRQALSSAVERAMQLAETAGLHPSRDGVTRTLEALSLASKPPEPPGRLIHPLQPGGFEMLAGVEPAKREPPENGVPLTGNASVGLKSRAPLTRAPARPDAKQLAAVERARKQAVAAQTRRRDLAIAELERAVDRSEAKASRARRAWEQATQELEAAERRLKAMRESHPDIDPSGA